MQAASNINLAPVASDTCGGGRSELPDGARAAFGNAMDVAARAAAHEPDPPALGPRLSRSVFDPNIDAMLHLDEAANALQIVRPAATHVASTPAALPPPPLPQGEDRTADPGHATEAANADHMPPLTAAPESLPSSSPPSPRSSALAHLRLGERDKGAGGPVARLQQVLARWNPRLGVHVDGRYGEDTARALMLFKSVYGTGHDGRRMDPKTAAVVAGMESGNFWHETPRKTAGGRLLYAASQQIGKPYHLGGDGGLSTDCGMLTRESMRRAGLVDRSFSRLADDQYRYAEQGQHGLSLTSTPQAGDLVFFNHPTRQSSQAYRGITHVGIYVGDGYMLAASSRHGKVVLQRVDDLAPYVSGYARPAQRATALLGRR